MCPQSPKLRRTRRFARKNLPSRPVDVDDKDFLDMMMTEYNEEEAAEVLGEPVRPLWDEETGEENKEKE